MAKKKPQDDVPNPSSVQNRDIMQRLNFLYQASALLGSVGIHAAPSKPSDIPQASEEKPAPDPVVMNKRQKRKREMLEQRNPTTALDLSRTYVRSMKTIGKKTTVRMDPAVKRMLCKKCDIVLIPGSTAIVRINPSGSHGNVVSYTCLACRTSRRIPAPAEPDAIPEHDAAASTVLHGASGGNNMELDTRTSSSQAGGGGPSHPRKKKKKPTKVPPLFARKDAGHITFRGNERIQD